MVRLIPERAKVRLRFFLPLCTRHITAGEMAARSTFAGIVVGAGGSLIVEYNMTGT